MRPGELSFARHLGGDYSAARQLWWKAGHWRPDADLRSLFQDIGREDHGEDLIEFWDDESYG